MTKATPVEKIRLAIAEQLIQLGVPATESLHETMLIRNGLFCGRKFQSEGYEVVWFIEEDELKFFSPRGELLKATSAIAFLLEAEQRRDQPSQWVAARATTLPQLQPQLSADTQRVTNTQTLATTETAVEAEPAVAAEPPERRAA